MSRDDSLPTELLMLKLEGTALTPAELRVLRRIALGDTVPEAAEYLGVGPETVKSQLRIARGRLGARNAAHAVAVAVSLDLI